MRKFFESTVVKKEATKYGKLVILIRDNKVRAVVHGEDEIHPIANYDLIGIPEKVKEDPKLYLRSFLADCHSTVNKASDGSYVATITPRLLGGGCIIKDRDKLWPKGIVPVRIGNDIQSGDRKTVIKAIKYWNENTNFRFVNYDPTRHKDYIVIGEEPTTKCYSYVGRQGGKQYVRCDLDDLDGDGKKFSAASLVHELGHVVGLYHEHSRSDRSQFLSVKTRNHNYGIKGQPFGKYDFDSMMHYPLQPGVMELKPHVFSSPLVTPPENNNPNNVGQRNYLSHGDIAAANRLVEAAGGPKSSGMQLDQSYDPDSCCSI